MTPRSPTPLSSGHCDRYGVTVATARPTRFEGLPRAWMAVADPFSQPVVSSRSLETGAPRAPGGSFIATRVGALASDIIRATLAAIAVVPTRRAPHTYAPRRTTLVTYSDRTLSCVDCGVEFIHSAADQEYYQQKGFVSDPKRCTSCRASRRASRDTGYDVRDIGGPRGYERGDDRPNREYFAVVCSSCGNQAQVPFKPRMDRPVYCSDCFRTVKPD